MALFRSPAFIFKLVFVVVLLVWPLILKNTYDMSVMTTAGFFAIMVIAVSLILGQAGQLSLGHNAFYGIGAYVAAILATTYHWPTLLALLVGALAAGLVALLIGRPILKLKYFYLALATLGLSQIFVIVVTQLTITGGANGFGPIPSLNIFGFEVSTYMRQYYVVWIVVILILLFTDRALKFRFGRSLRSLATSEIAASTLGVRTANWKLVAFVVGAVFCGLAGGLFAFVSVAIMPGSFAFAAAVLPVVMMLVGGDQSIWGGAIGAILLTWVINGFPQLQEYSGVTYSTIMILLLMFLPMGIAGLFAVNHRGKLRKLFRMKPKEAFGEADALPGVAGEAGHAVDFEPSTATAAAQAVPEAIKDGAAETATAAAPAGEVLLRVEGVTVQFGGLKAVNDVTMEVLEGEITALIGPNGAGKTTLFNAVSRLQSVTAGKVLFAGRDITRLTPSEAARAGMARTFQNLRIFGNMSVLENVLVGCHRHEHSGMLADGLGLPRQRAEEKASRERAMTTLELLGLEQYAARPASSLPYGIQRLVEIARAVASEPRLLMLDEPAAGMNASERAYLVDRIARIRDAGITVLLVEHDIGLVMGISDAVNCLDYGKLIACGTPGVVQEDPAVIAAYLGDGKARVSHERAASGEVCEDCLLVVENVVTSYGSIEALHGVSLRSAQGPDRRRARRQRGRQDDPAGDDLRPSPTEPRTHHLSRFRHRPGGAAPDRAARSRSRAGGASALPDSQRGGQSGHGRYCAGRQGRAGRRHRLRLRGLPGARRAT